jgi:Tfp pilus assembly protein PilO
MTARDRKMLAGIALLAILAGFWFLVVKPKRAEVQALGGQIATQQQRLQTAQSTVAAGVAAKAAYPRNYATVAELGKAVPADDDLASLLYQLDAAADGHHIDFSSINRATGGSASTGTSSTTATTSGSSAAALPPGATVGTAGLATLPFTFAFNGSFADLQRFIAGVQGFVRTSDGKVAVRGRLLTVDGVSLVPGANGLSRLTAKIAATAYLAPSTTPASGSGAGSSSGSTAPAAPAPTSSAIAGPSN